MRFCYRFFQCMFSGAYLISHRLGQFKKGSRLGAQWAAPQMNSIQRPSHGWHVLNRNGNKGVLLDVLRHRKIRQERKS